jgi:hypothetical protein
MKPPDHPLLICLSSFLHCSSSLAALTEVVDLGYTGVQGVRNASSGQVQRLEKHRHNANYFFRVDSFLGIPYAVAPVGDLRWYLRLPFLVFLVGGCNN